MVQSTPAISFDKEKIADFCQRWRINEFSLFGSVVTEDYSPDSDVDVLVSFDPEARWTLFDLDRMEDELRDIFARRVDLVTRGSVEASPNYLRRKSILESVTIIHDSR
jgi:predicted nucleotidyltransferase